jgi:hypothetical protein
VTITPCFFQVDWSRLPEDVWYEIIQQIPTQSDLARVARVKHNWTAPARRALYTHVNFDSERQLYLFTRALVAQIRRSSLSMHPDISLWVRHVTLQPHGRIIHHKMLMYMRLLATVLPLLQNVESITWVLTRWRNEELHEYFGEMVGPCIPLSLTSLHLWVSYCLHILNSADHPNFSWKIVPRALGTTWNWKTWNAGPRGSTSLKGCKISHLYLLSTALCLIPTMQQISSPELSAI